MLKEYFDAHLDEREELGFDESKIIKLMNPLDEEGTNTYDAWLLEQDNGDSYEEHKTSQPADQYFTTYGGVDGYQVANILANQATYHAFTGSDMFEGHLGQLMTTKTPKKCSQPPSTFYLEDRYLHTFQGIMPDTGAAGISTGGEPQMRALQQTHPHIQLIKVIEGYPLADR
ncbi:hypothetical protein F5Y00DRAFT_264316 [Daldinia vernicosa]|uniref:uncharacterized protein n=1 Tax=Daldinia vernicosa TaxID=114800 RepID=UPI002008DE0F|nr:uncharacterized protein F5Y00DRAFT_264316 [Daldinia vernicosa]KAI0846702.1 hypothetical protein F5Y00DRAFT_264316 [Daldinia vernicosa]